MFRISLKILELLAKAGKIDPSSIITQDNVMDILHLAKEVMLP